MIDKVVKSEIALACMAEVSSGGSILAGGKLLSDT